MRRLLLIGLALMPVMAMAQGFQVNLDGQKQIGMGHTGTGLLQDGASVLFNPGAVAMLPQNYAQAGISPLLFESAFQSAGSNVTYKSNNKVATPFNAYAVWGPAHSNFKFGFGIYTPFGGLTDWGQSWEGKYSLESLNLKAIYFQPTVSYKINDDISIGAGFVYNDASVDLTNAIPVQGAAGQDGQAELKGSGHGFGYNAGIFVDTHSQFTIGLTYRSQVNTKISGGSAIFTNIPASLASSFPANDQFSSQIPLPSTTSLGFGYYPNKQWTVALDLNYVNWSVYKSLDFAYTAPVNGAAVTSEARNYKDAFDFRLGAEYKCCPKAAIRVGGGYATTSVQDGYVSPEAPDANRIYGTVGIGYKVCTKLDLDASFEYENLMSRTQTNFQTGLAGTFKTNVFIPGVSLAYHW